MLNWVDLECPICCDIVSGAVQTPCCKKNYCSSCLGKWIKSHRNCPSCRNEIESIDKCSHSAEIDVLALEISIICPNKSCGDQFARRDLKKHIKECKFQPVKCPNDPLCKIVRMELFNHQENCQYLELECPDCKVKVKRKRFLNHHNECPEVKFDCDMNCGMKIHRKNLVLHKDQCPEQVIACYFVSKGCTQNQIKRKDYIKHLESEVGFHLDMAVRNLDKKIENLQLQLHTKKSKQITQFEFGSKSLTSYEDGAFIEKVSGGNSWNSCIFAHKPSKKITFRLVSESNGIAFGFCSKHQQSLDTLISSKNVGFWCSAENGSTVIHPNKNVFNKHLVLKTNDIVKLVYDPNKQVVLYINERKVYVVDVSLGEGFLHPCFEFFKEGSKVQILS